MGERPSERRPKEGTLLKAMEFWKILIQVEEKNGPKRGKCPKFGIGNAAISLKKR